MEGVARPDGVPLVGVLAPSPMGLRLEVWSTCGEKETGVGVTRAVAAVVGMYVGTEATAGLVGINGGVTRGGGGDIDGFWVMGDTTFTGLWGLGRTKGGGALTVGEEGSAGGSGGFAVGLEGREGGGLGVTTGLDADVGGRGRAAGEDASFGEAEVEATVETAILGA